MKIFAIVWSLAIATADVCYGGFLLRQLRSGGYARTTGEITAIAVTSHRDENTVMHGLALEYTYRVQGRAFRGTHYRALVTESSGSWAEDVVRGLPVGAHVPVYYSPDDPGQALLRSGLSAGDAFLGLFLLPLNSIALALWASVRGLGPRSRTDDATGGLRIVETNAVTRVLPQLYGPAGTALLWGSVAAFLLAIVCGIAFGFELPPQVMTAVTATVLVTAAGAYARAVARQRSGSRDLIIDAAARTLRLPLGRRADPAEPIPWSTVADIVVETSSGVSTQWFWISVRRADGDSVRVRSATWLERAPAERFRGWLAARIAGHGGGAHLSYAQAARSKSPP
jgi:hypothetical protein